jgi:hypothetical protein
MAPLDPPLDFRTTSLADLAGAVRTRQISARELTAHALARIEALNPTYNAFVAVNAEQALAEAAAVDEFTAKGGDPGALAGIPLAVKDNHDAVGFRSTFGAPVLADAPLASADSPFVARLRGAGCGHGPAGYRFRRGRVHPHPLGRLRPLGHEALPRPGPRRRPEPARLARPLNQRSHGPPHRRRRDRPRCGRRPRPVGPALTAAP